ncbi:hypothetical protein HFO21_16460 [Rhizobium laguerreae]|uniref:hypothetical protein n=1 Tax=Rhizobium laguerreae TaxID=1076926 RepID=UPI001C90B7D2|nr:hypothetical protein [Rhizobium laguerreae]MBY3215934.1 hypothetical protein [Rhizobium laguerreae]
MTNKWSVEIKHMRSLSADKRSSTFRSFIVKECGPALSVREARSQFYLLTAGALDGHPRLIAVDGATAVLMSLGDLEGMLLDLALATFVKGLRKVSRRKVQNR